MKKSLLDVAYEIISQSDTEILFKDLWVKVNQVEGESPENMQGKIGKFYTALLTDGRFVNLGDNKWGLRENYAFDKVHIDMSDCYTDEDDSGDYKDPDDLLVEKEDEDLYKEEEKENGDEDEDEDDSDYENSQDSEEDL